MCRSAWILSALLSLFFHFSSVAAEDQKAAAMQRGKLTYNQVCWVCHQANGLGLPGIFPPLAKSDYLMEDRERSIRILITGLTNKIVVNGKSYQGVMPPSGLSDEKIADVVTYIRNSWENSDPKIVTSEEVKKVRAQLPGGRRRTAKDENTYPALPTAPAGFQLRELVQMPENPVRIISDAPQSRLYILSGRGAVFEYAFTNRELRQILWPETYIDSKKGDANSVGMTLDAQHRLYLVVNHRNETAGPLVSNLVTIFRAQLNPGSVPDQPKPWFETSYPWGIGPYNHGVGAIAFGPDGKLYVSSGSRTDGNETGKNAKYWTGGEHEVTACIWRLDPAAEKPALEIYARGLRNTYGITWDDQGRLFGTDNGPDAHAPEELNWISEGKHYGFPFQYSDWKEKPYPYTPDLPAGVQVTLPVVNLGPSAAGKGQPMSTFDPHSSPAGIIYLGKDWPELLRNSFLTVRFGNLLPIDRDVGFDLLQIRLTEPSGPGPLRARVTTLLAPLGRPIDLTAAQGKIYIAEYSRGTSFRGEQSMLPGRILELAPAK